jgi:hypothetical protein
VCVCVCVCVIVKCTIWSRAVWKSSINPIINQNPVYRSHAITRRCNKLNDQIQLSLLIVFKILYEECIIHEGWLYGMEERARSWLIFRGNVSLLLEEGVLCGGISYRNQLSSL